MLSRIFRLIGSLVRLPHANPAVPIFFGGLVACAVTILSFGCGHVVVLGRRAAILPIVSLPWPEPPGCQSFAHAGI
jgi:hypothetical protein